MLNKPHLSVKDKRCFDDLYKCHLAAQGLIEKSYQLDDPQKREALIAKRHKLYCKVDIILKRIGVLVSHIISQRMKEEYGVNLDTLYNSYICNDLLSLGYTLKEKTEYKSSLRDVTIIAIDCKLDDILNCRFKITVAEDEDSLYRYKLSSLSLGEAALHDI